MLWLVLTEKQVIVITESHKHGTHKCNYKGMWDARSNEDVIKMIKWFYVDAEMRKRLKEAAEIAQKKVTPNQDWGDIYHGFKKGAEFGYKEAIKAAKKWLDEQGKLDQLDLVEFDMEMNKPLEEQK